MSDTTGLDSIKRLVSGSALNAPYARAPIGPSVFGGKLFFKLADGSTVLCTCIGEPYASAIVEAWNLRLE